MQRLNRFMWVALAALLLQACGSDQDRDAHPLVRIDGSSTVFPVTEAVAEEFQLGGQRVRVTVGLSGSGGGFKKLCRGDIDISSSSRPILKEEMENCRKAGIRYIELPIAFDAITVVVNPQNTWVSTMTVADLKKIWEPAAQGKLTRWNQIRPEWPDAPMMLFGPGADSGTFDYFTEAVTGHAKSSRGDYTASEDDNVLVQGVEHNRNALAYFGYAYYTAHRQRMRVVPIIGAAGQPVEPSPETVTSGDYAPLARPLFIYIAEKSAQRADVRHFVEYYLSHGNELVREVGFVPLTDAVSKVALEHFRENRLGTVFGGVPEIGVTIESLLQREARL